MHGSQASSHRGEGLEGGRLLTTWVRNLGEVGLLATCMKGLKKSRFLDTWVRGLRELGC